MQQLNQTAVSDFNEYMALKTLAKQQAREIKMLRETIAELNPQEPVGAMRCPACFRSEPHGDGTHVSDAECLRHLPSGWQLNGEGIDETQ